MWLISQHTAAFPHTLSFDFVSDAALSKIQIPPQILTAKTHLCMICDIFKIKVNGSLALIKEQGLTGTALSIQIVPFGFGQSL